MRDKNYQETDCASNTVRVAPLRERLEMRKVRIQESIKYQQEELANVEEGLKLLNKNKQLETLVNLIQL